MRISFITPWYPDEKLPHSGIFIRTHAKALADKNEVIVISAKVDNSKFSLSNYSLTQSHVPNLTEYRLTINRSLPLFNQVHQLFITWRMAYRLLKHANVDVIHSFIGYPGAILGWLLSKSLGVPFVHTEHTRLRNNYRSFFHKKLTQFGMLRTSCLTAVSNSLAKELRDDTRKQVLVIPNMIAVSRFHLAHQLPGDIIHIGFLGGMNTRVKGLDILLQALTFCEFSFCLHIGGSGKLLEEYITLSRKLRIEKQCFFYGFIPYENIPSFYNKLHFFVCSSRYETFNVSIIEAMASGIPVVSTKCGGPEEIVTNATGLLVENENPNALAEGINKMVENLDDYLSERIRSHIVNNYSVESIIPRHEKLYKSIVEAKLLRPN
jgi:L-malate glycosyltransferase